MRSLASIIFAALMLPALLLPADLTLCICELIGKSAPMSCCSQPCCAKAHSATPTVNAARCSDCRVATPHQVSTAPSKENQDLRGDTVVVAPTLALVDETPAAEFFRAPRVDAFLRDELRRPPPLLARAQPLLL
jgi:hypothetical protein